MLTFTEMQYQMLKVKEIIHILNTFNLTSPPGYMINITPTNVLCQNLSKHRIQHIKFQMRDAQSRTVDFNRDVLSFTLHLF